jgi:SAM-dependent methyltransferase
MKLNKLVSLKNDADLAFDVSKVVAAMADLRKKLELIIDRYELTENYSSIVNNTIQLIDIKLAELDIIESRKTLLTNNLLQDIEELTKKFFAANYETEFVYNEAEGVRQARILYIPQHAEPILMSRIDANLDWRYATLEIGCRDGEFTKHLVAGDPLYVTDVHQEFLDSTVKAFNTDYQRRIRPYLIKDQNFSMLPQEQFGFVFSWNHFNYLSLDTIKHYLQQIYNLLKPGGKVLFSYNNGDLPAAAEYAERYYMTYMPKSLLIPMCEMLGFEIINHQDFEPAVSWIELKRPGELTTVKAHQVLGTIKPNN